MSKEKAICELATAPKTFIASVPTLCHDYSTLCCKFETEVGKKRCSMVSLLIIKNTQFHFPSIKLIKLEQYENMKTGKEYTERAPQSATEGSGGSAVSHLEECFN